LVAAGLRAAEPAPTAVALLSQAEAVQRARRDLRTAREQHDEQIAALDAQIDRLTRQTAAAGSALTEARRINAEQAQQLAAVDAEVAALKQAFAETVTAAQAAAAAHEQRVRAGIPYRHSQRLAALSTIHAQLAGDLEAQLAGLRAWTRFASEEARLAVTTELLNAEVPVEDGRRKHAYIVRIGLVNAVFITEDEQQFGVAAGAAGWTLVTDPAAQQQIRLAREMLRRLQAPALLPLPFTPGKATP
jgi:hypothetical protein